MNRRWQVLALAAAGCGPVVLTPHGSGGGSGGSDGGSSSDGATGAGCVECGHERSIASGGDHTCARIEGGNVRCWGRGFSGAPGYGNQQNVGDDELPAAAGDVDVGGAVLEIVAGNGHSCALLDGGEVRCWGAGDFGQLGYGNTADIGDDEVPADVGSVDVGGVVVALEAGSHHSCALLDTGGVRCWGAADSGQLGYGNTVAIGDDETPAIAGDVDIGGTVLELAAGGLHTCVRLDTGAVRCWGAGAGGQLGHGDTMAIGDDETPASAGDIELGAPAMEIAAGEDHTCARLEGGAVRCWGQSERGQLGYGNTDDVGDDETPATVGDVDVGGAVAELTAGSAHTCARLETDAVRCWGWAHDGELGYGNEVDIGDDETPASAGDVDIGGHATELSAGDYHSCVRTDSAGLRCWGFGEYGQLGYGNTDVIGDDETPASVGDVLVH